MAETTKKTTSKKAPKVEKSLQEQLADKRSDLLEAKKSHRSGELVNPKILNVYRKDIARLLTSINQAKEGK